MLGSASTRVDTAAIQTAKDRLDAHVRDIVRWHFSPETGCPFWLERAKASRLRSAQDVQTYDDLDQFGPFQDEWLRGGPVRRWVPKAYADRPTLRVRDRRQHGRAQVAHRTSTTSASTTRISARRCPTSLSEGRGLADGRAHRSAPAAPGGRAPGAASAAASVSWSISIRAGSSS